MKALFLIFPHQLFEALPEEAKDAHIYLVEEYLFFRQFNFHKMKLAFHRATMKKYEQYLKDRGYSVDYIEQGVANCDVRNLLASLAKVELEKVLYYELVDDWLERRILTACKNNNLKTKKIISNYFLNTEEELDEWASSNKNYFHHNFYIAQRKKRNILMDGKEPQGGQWSYDHDNRKKFPKNGRLSSFPSVQQDKYVKEARDYVEENFPGNYGVAESMLYPTGFSEAKDWLDDFLRNRFHSFGDYEDAILKQDHKLFHSILSPLINCGLLTPDYVLKTTLKKATELKVPINSVEGFVRQIIGWREFIRMLYVREGRMQRTKNYFGFTRNIPLSFWEGSTGIVPIDTVIKEVLRTGYCHHIERLMLLGNFMLLCEFDPDEVYKWFMELFIDAYDWVMVPNVYGMTQCADGGLMTTKPYISGSNYVLKMSNYKKGEWCDIWDGLFWRFMTVHRETFENNNRMRMLLGTYDKMDEDKRSALQETAENFLAELDKKNK